jgi:hypothetical protein
MIGFWMTAITITAIWSGLEKSAGWHLFLPDFLRFDPIGIALFHRLDMGISPGAILKILA